MAEMTDAEMLDTLRGMLTREVNKREAAEARVMELEKERALIHSTIRNRAEQARNVADALAQLNQALAEKQ